MKRKTKNRILKTITGIAVIFLFAGASGLDGENFIVPLIMIVFALLWLSVFAAANSE